VIAGVLSNYSIPASIYGSWPALTLGSRRRVDLASSGLKALDVYRLAQIADRLEVSVDWLFGRSDVMELPQR
jgi:hypothetical protein